MSLFATTSESTIAIQLERLMTALELRGAVRVDEFVPDGISPIEFYAACCDAGLLLMGNGFSTWIFHPEIVDRAMDWHDTNQFLECVAETNAGYLPAPAPDTRSDLRERILGLPSAVALVDAIQGSPTARTLDATHLAWTAYLAIRCSPENARDMDRIWQENGQVPQGWESPTEVRAALDEFADECPRWALNGWCGRDETEHLVA